MNSNTRLHGTSQEKETSTKFKSLKKIKGEEKGSSLEKRNYHFLLSPFCNLDGGEGGQLGIARTDSLG